MFLDRASKLSLFWVVATLALVALTSNLQQAQAIPRCCLAFGKPNVTLGDMKACKEICAKFNEAVLLLKSERLTGEDDFALIKRIGRDRIENLLKKTTIKPADAKNTTIRPAEPKDKPAKNKKLKECQRKLAKAMKKIKSLERKLKEKENPDDDD